MQGKTREVSIGSHKPKKKLPAWTRQASGTVAIPSGSKKLGSKPKFAPKVKGSIPKLTVKSKSPVEKKAPAGSSILRTGGSVAKLFQGQGNKLKVNKKNQKRVNSILGL